MRELLKTLLHLFQGPKGCNSPHIWNTYPQAIRFLHSAIVGSSTGPEGLLTQPERFIVHTGVLWMESASASEILFADDISV